MQAAILSYGDLASSNGACGNCRAGLSIDPQGRRPSCSRVRGFDIEEITVHRVAQVVKQMQGASGVHDCLWLNPPVWHADDRNVRASCPCRGRHSHDSEKEEKT